jgi:hypothetical protein
MRETKRIFPTFLFFLILLQFFSCSSSQKLSSQENLIIGRWVLESASFDGQVIKAEVFGGEISFEFTKEGFATFKTSEGQIERGRYQIQANKLFDPDSPDEVPADIVSLTKEHFIMSMEEEGETVTMRFVPDLD